MFQTFFHELKQAKVPVTLKEYLMLMEALDRDVIEKSVDEFYYLSRATLVKDEKHLDRFDQVFGHVFKGLEKVTLALPTDVQAEWLKALSDKFLTEEDRKLIEEMGGFDKLMEMLAERIREAKERGEMGDEDGEGKRGRRPNGNSPFGANGFHPEGIRIGQDKGRHGRAIKVWDKREYKNLDDLVELGTRNIKVALRRLRKFARQGVPDELDIKGTIKETANKGYLDLIMQPERRNTIKVLLFFDIGGSMDSHIKICEELFSAAKTEFKNMEFFYFHNCLYESVWKDNRRRNVEKIPTWDVLEQVSRRLQGDLRRRRHHEPLRDHLSRRLGRTLERGAGRGLGRPRDPVLRQRRVAEPGRRAPLGLHALDRGHPPADQRPDVRADARRPRQGHARTGARVGAASSVGGLELPDLLVRRVKVAGGGVEAIERLLDPLYPVEVGIQPTQVDLGALVIDQPVQLSDVAL